MQLEVDNWYLISLKLLDSATSLVAISFWPKMGALQIPRAGWTICRISAHQQTGLQMPCRLPNSFHRPRVSEGTKNTGRAFKDEPRPRTCSLRTWHFDPCDVVFLPFFPSFLALFFPPGALHAKVGHSFSASQLQARWPDSTTGRRSTSKDLGSTR